MIRILLLSLFLCVTTCASAQDFSKPDYYKVDGEIVTVDSITYRIRLVMDLILFDNLNNILIDAPMEYLDGRVYDEAYGLEMLVQDRPGTIERAFQETFTPEEADKMRKSAENIITIGYVVSPQGDVLEVDMDIIGSPLMRSFPPSKYALLEKNIKKFVKCDVTPNGKTLKFIHTMSFANLSAVDLYPESKQLTPTDPSPSGPGFQKGGGELRGN